MASTTPTPSPTTVNESNQSPAPLWLQDVAVINTASTTTTSPSPNFNQVGKFENDKVSEENHDEDKNNTQAGVLHSAISYTPKTVLAEGHVHLKGSGKDWFGSRSWKARYARLVLADVQGVEAPLLLIYWFQSSIEPSTVITLDSTVVLPVEKDDQDAWNAHCLEIIHVTSRGEQRVTRTFTAGTKDARDTWLLVLNQCLLQYEKSKSHRNKENKKKNTASNTLATTTLQRLHSPPKSPVERFADDMFPSAKQASKLSTPTFSPPMSPRSSSSEKLPLPRSSNTDTLAGESLVA